jgi:hypothetical protein
VKEGGGGVNNWKFVTCMKKIQIVTVPVVQLLSSGRVCPWKAIEVNLN